MYLEQIFKYLYCMWTEEDGHAHNWLCCKGPTTESIISAANHKYKLVQIQTVIKYNTASNWPEHKAVCTVHVQWYDDVLQKIQKKHNVDRGLDYHHGKLTLAIQEPRS